jgi:hypothetical protein
MTKATPYNLQGVLNRSRGWRRLARKAKKILNRRNEPKDLLKTQELAFSGPQNELFFERQKRQSKRKIWPKIDRSWGRRARFGCRKSSADFQKDKQQSEIGNQ